MYKRKINNKKLSVAALYFETADFIFWLYLRVTGIYR
jgi:hypothetical protein